MIWKDISSRSRNDPADKEPNIWEAKIGKGIMKTAENHEKYIKTPHKEEP